MLRPALVVASGGFADADDTGPTPAETLAAALVTLGVPAEIIEREARSRNTREQALFAADLLGRRQIRRFVLVTEAHHMPRAVRAFRALGFDPVPSVPPPGTQWPEGRLARVRPSLPALRLSDWASYEHVAGLYYRLRGWTR
jgi:uncharacterized SAM-binding protein YcdF (DUF218 family)